MNRAGLIGPLILIAMGFLFLMNNFGLHLPFREVVRAGWPFVLIAVGMFHLFQFITQTGVSHGHRRSTLIGGLVLVTVGILFLLQNLADIRFGQTWPVLLIVIGLGSLLAMMFPVLGRIRR